MLFKQKLFAILAALFILVLIIELVRRRKMREEYSFLWIITGVIILILTIWDNLLVFLSKLIGAGFLTTTIFLFGFIFLMLVSIHFSIKFSTLTSRIEKLAQQLAILKHKIDKLSKKRKNNV